jgi:hypothetical protein
MATSDHGRFPYAHASADTVGLHAGPTGGRKNPFLALLAVVYG